MPIDYSKAKIYCIRSPNTDLIYIGSSCQQLSQRMSQHRADLKRGKTITSKVILEHGEAYIELLENYPCANKEELDKKEGEHIRLTQNCCNKFIAGRTTKQYKEDNKELIKQYYEANKERILDQQKQYYEDNKEAKIEKSKQYREAKKEAIAEQKKKYYKERKAQAIAVA